MALGDGDVNVYEVSFGRFDGSKKDMCAKQNAHSCSSLSEFVPSVLALELDERALTRTLGPRWICDGQPLSFDCMKEIAYFPWYIVSYGEDQQKIVFDDGVYSEAREVER